MRCTHIKSNKERCKAKAIKDSNYCFTHHPNYDKKRAVARRRGGLNRKHYDCYHNESIPLTSPQDAQKLLELVINGVLRGKIPAKQPANTIGFLTRCWLDAYKEEKRVLSEKPLKEIGCVIQLPKRKLITNKIV